MNQTLIDRREALRKTALLMGAAVSATAVMGILKGCKTAPELNYVPKFFTQDQAHLMSELAELFIPKTETPGAKESGVPGFIDQVLEVCYKEVDKERFIKELTEFDADAKKTYGDEFAACSPSQQTEIVLKYSKDALEQTKGKIRGKKPFILAAKELTLLGYFTSEVGATKVLQYEEVPGAYHGCLPLDKTGNGKTWATS